MPFPPERKTILVKQEAVRRRFLTICERCFPEWTKRLTGEQLDGLIAYFLQEMPPEIAWLERTDGLTMGGGYPADALDSQPIIDPDPPPDESAGSGPPDSGIDLSKARFNLVAIERHSYIPRVTSTAETVQQAALWLPWLLHDPFISPCRFCAHASNARWIMRALEKLQSRPR